LDPGLVALALLNVTSFNNNLTAIIQMWTSLETSLGAIARLKNFNEHTRSENLAEECGTVPDNWPSNGSVKFSNLSAAYAHDLPEVVKNVDLVIAPGERVGICGTTGSGKSSLIASMFRMLEIGEGSISIDGVDLSKIPRQTIREHLNAIPQDPFFLRGTIRQNIDPLGQSPDMAVEAALRKVGLWNIVSSTPSPLDSEMDTEGLLSQGQRQLFCLARAILKPAKIIVLDEVTASVDLQTDELMQKIIRESFKNCTIIAVAHRLQTITDFDRVIVMQSGRIVEHGEPQELLANAGSHFRRLWDA
jgi:ATP-binding cassette, subfamily C (CFTR/MRP), member 1